MTNKFSDVDSLSRESIIKDLNTNLFVEAGAGSGKTTMLVNRMVAMIESGIPVEKICAITFTKNAALEFYQRFEALLIERSNPNLIYKTKGYAGELKEPNNITRNYCATALENIDLCFMGTIDSFCNMILSEHPSSAGIPSDASLIDPKQEKEDYQNFYIELREGKYGDELKKLSGTFSKLFNNPEEVFYKIIKIIMDRRNVTFVYDEVKDLNLNNLIGKDYKDLLSALKVFNQDKTKIIIDVKEDEDVIDVFNSCYRTLRRPWANNFSSVVYALNKISTLKYEGDSKDLGLINESCLRDNAGYISLNINEKDNENSLLNRISEYKYAVSLTLANKSFPLLEEKMREEGKFTFFDYLLFLRNMLKEDASNGGELINYIYERHSYFLIDEFQDTNPLQSEIFFYLSSTNPKSNWLENKPRGGSLFIVGDPKQSIYRFRNADISSYIKIKDIFDSGVGKVLSLTNNFRSRNVLKNYFNDVFSEVMNETSSDQCEYQTIENTNNTETNMLEGVYNYISYSGKAIIDNPDMRDDLRIASIIKGLINNPKYLIADKGEEPRRIKYSDFMIIYAAKKNIAKCINTFKELNIPLKAEGKVLFEDSEALKLLRNTIACLNDYEDSISLIYVLKSKLFKYSEGDIVEYKNKFNHLSLAHLDNSDLPLAKTLITLNSLSTKIKNYSVSMMYEDIIDDLHIFDYVEDDNLEIVFYALELIKNKEINGEIKNYEDGVNYIDELLAGDSDLERCLSLKENDNSVHIANLHKVKGLEAPIVILGKSASVSSKPSIRVEHRDDGTKGFILKVDNPDTYGTIIENNKLVDEIEKEKISANKENDRLIYVAATRARNVLIVNDPRIMRKDKLVGTSNKWKVLLDKENKQINNLIEFNSDELNNETFIIDKDALNNKYQFNYVFDNKEKVLASSYQKKTPSTLMSDSLFTEEENVSEGTIEESGDTFSTLIGTMAHRLMEAIITSKDTYKEDEAINMIISDYLTSDFKDKEILFRNKLSKIYRTIHNGGFIQKGRVVQDILPILLKVDEVYSEVPFAYKDDGILWKGTIDLIYKQDNKYHIIDWKTNKNDDDLDNHYKEQLNAYKKAVKKLLNIEVEDALIYHLDITD